MRYPAAVPRKHKPALYCPDAAEREELASGAAPGHDFQLQQAALLLQRQQRPRLWSLSAALAAQPREPADPPDPRLRAAHRVQLAGPGQSAQHSVRPDTTLVQESAAGQSPLTGRQMTRAEDLVQC